MKPPIKPTILRALRSGKPVTLSKLTTLTNSTKVATHISELRRELRREGRDIVNRTFYKNGEFQKSTYTLV